MSSDQRYLWPPDLRAAHYDSLLSQGYTEPHSWAVSGLWSGETPRKARAEKVVTVAKDREPMDPKKDQPAEAGKAGTGPGRSTAKNHGTGPGRPAGKRPPSRPTQGPGPGNRGPKPPPEEGN